MIFRSIFITLGLGLLLIAPFAFAANGDLILQIPVPDSKKSGEDMKIIRLCEPDGTCNGMATYFGGIFIWLVRAVAVVAVVVLMVGGLQWMTARGDTGQTTKARKVISNALIGLVLTLSSYMILYTINPATTQWAPLNLTPVQKLNLDIKAITPSESLSPEEEKITSAKKTEIILHHSAGPDSKSCEKIQEPISKKIVPKCHYWILTDGQQENCASDTEVLPCMYGANVDGIGIEISSIDGVNFTNAQIEKTAVLVKKIATENNIPLSNVTTEMNLNVEGKPIVGHTGKKGGIFNHSNVCALVNYGTDKKSDPPENIFETILKKAGGTYTASQPRCPGTQKGVIK